MQNNPYANVPGCDVNVVKTYNFHIVEKAGKYGVWVIDPAFADDCNSPGYFAAQTGTVFNTVNEAEQYARKCLIDPTFANELKHVYSNNNYLRNQLVQTAAKIDAMELLIQEFNEYQIELRTKREKQRDREFELECRYDESKEDVPGLPEAV